MTYPIVLYGEPVLEKNAETVTDFDTPEMHQLIDDMFESMYTAKGVGLAAPQIGIAKRIAVIDLSTGEDLLARAFSHEIDHLNGRLYITHVSALKRDLIRRKVRKLAKAGEWGNT